MNMYVTIIIQEKGVSIQSWGIGGVVRRHGRSWNEGTQGGLEGEKGEIDIVLF